MDYISALKELLNNKKALINTYGCQQNENDSQKLAGILRQTGCTFTDKAEEADIILFNTCAIRENAEQKVFGTIGSIKKLKEQKPSLIVIVTGCMMGEEHNIKKIKTSYRQVDIILSANNPEKLPEKLYQHIMSGQMQIDTEYQGFIAEGLPYEREDKIKAGIPIMYGCNNFCSYCIVPYVRGRERSRKEEDILREAKELKEQGYREIMLLGQNVNSYMGGGDKFAELLKKVSDTGIDRIRFMTSHPKDLSKSVIDVIHERDNICKCLHLPLQSGSDRILKLMNRHYDTEKYLSIIDYAKEKIPDITITTDIIVGFPGETNEDFEKTLEILEKVRYDTLYSFIFSPRKGTPAEKMEDVLTEKEKKQNFEKLLQVQNRISLEKNLKMLNKTVSVLCEGESKTDKSVLSGRTEGGKIVNFEGPKELEGKIINLKITEAKTWNLKGERTE